MSTSDVLDNGMTAGQLIEALQGFDEDTPVVFVYNYGDCWNTTVAQPVNTVSNEMVEYSPYHQMPKVVDQFKDNEGAEWACIIKG